MFHRTPFFYSIIGSLFLFSSSLLQGQETCQELFNGSYIQFTNIGRELCSLVLQDTPEEPAGHHHGLKSGRTDTHAPTGLMGDHAHGKGEMMVEYKYVNMYMGGSRAGHTAISTGAARMFDGNMFMVVPEAMSTELMPGSAACSTRSRIQRRRFVSRRSGKATTGEWMRISIQQWYPQPDRITGAGSGLILAMA
tara:strand:+ start:2881 stop:3462 length:582 start_codon:yes stop_codon:yes gene_type:complete